MLYQSGQRGYWADFPDTYRHEQVVTLARWVAAGESGSLIGGSGTGKSNLIGFLSIRPDVLAASLPNTKEPFVLIHFDVNSLPALTLTYFYRGLIQALQNASGLNDETQEKLGALITSVANWDDAFFVLSTLRTAHQLLIDGMNTRIVWLIDRFDEACQRLDAQALSSLRSLRDQLKGRLCYIVATRHPIEQLRDPAEMDEFYEIIAANRCWIGPMAERDARWVVRQMGERLGVSFAEDEFVQLFRVTGGLPAFLKEACTARANGELPQLVASPITTASVTQALSERPEVRRSCREIWTDLREVEQQTLMQIAAGDASALPHEEARAYLQSAGLVLANSADSTFSLFSPILQTYVKEQGEAIPAAVQSGVALHPKTRAVIRNGVQLDVELTNHEDRLLAYFLDHVDEVCSKDALMNAVWPDDQVVEGIRDDRLAQLAKRLRDKIEPFPNNPRYIITVRSRGYRFVQSND